MFSAKLSLKAIWIPKKYMDSKQPYGFQKAKWIPYRQMDSKQPYGF
jgi:hypothetical protein